MFRAGPGREFLTARDYDDNLSSLEVLPDVLIFNLDPNGMPPSINLICDMKIRTVFYGFLCRAATKG